MCYRTVVCLFAFVLFLATSPLTAECIVYQQLPGPHSNSALTSSTIDGVGGIPGLKTADNFQLAQSADITGVRWWGLHSMASDGSNGFQFTFYADEGGNPGTALHTTGGSLVTHADVPTNWTTQYESEFTLPFSATAGTTYWISVFNGAPLASWFWLRADLSGDNSRQGYLPVTSWGVGLEDRAFQLIGVPEPATIVLISVGLLGLMALSRRRPAATGAVRSES